MRVAWSHSGRSVDGFDALLDQYGATEFASPRRSTVPLLAYWCDAESRLEQFSEALGAVLSGNVSLDFEHEVPVQQGSGKPSCTDLMILSDRTSVAVEGKFTESRYDDVATWLGDPASANRAEVLAGWLHLLGQCAGRTVTADDVMGLTYQLIHRAASACHPDVDSRWLAYQVFEVSAEKRAMYLSDLTTLASLLGPAPSLSISALLNVCFGAAPCTASWNASGTPGTATCMIPC